MALEQVSSRGEAHLELNAFRRKHDCALVISGDSLEVLQHTATHLHCTADDAEDAAKQEKHSSAKTEDLERKKMFLIFCSNVCFVSLCLQVCLRYYEHEFVELACQCPAVVCCRCSPTQKAQIVTLLQQHTANRTCAIGEQKIKLQCVQWTNFTTQIICLRLT